VVYFADSCLDSPEEHRIKLRKLNEAIRTDPHAYIEELRVTHEHIHRRVVILGEVRKDSGEVRFGVEHEGFAPDGRPVRVRYYTTYISCLQYVNN